MELTKPLGYYTDNTSLRFHMLDVGEGLMILIFFPNDQVMLFHQQSIIFQPARGCTFPFLFLLC